MTYRKYNQKFPYVDMEETGYVIKYGSRELLIEEMRARGIECCIEPAIDVKSNELLLKLSAEHPDFIYPAAGNHPTRCIYSSWGDFKLVREYAGMPGVIAVGETGLDYHLARKEQRRFRQKIWFWYQIDLAYKLDLPLILHIRDADEDAIRILRLNKRKIKDGVVHCFGSGPDAARVYTEEFGLCIGIGGTLLMKPSISARLEQTVASIPMKYLLLETDAPFVKPFKPSEFSNKQWEKARNTSFILPAVAKKISEIKGISEDEVISVTTANTKRVFGLS